MQFIGSVIKMIIALAMMVGVAMVGLYIFTNSNFNFKFGGSTAVPTPASTVIFTIKPGDSVTTIADNLKEQGLIDSPTIFKLQLRLKGAQNVLKAGNFQLSPGTSTDKLIETLSTSPAELGVRFTVIEGMRIGEIADKLAKEGLVDRDKFVQLAGTPEGAATYNDDFLKASGRPQDHDLEGYLFPDTYEIKQSGGDDSDGIIRKMLGTMEEKFTPEMSKAVADRQLSIQQVMTIASIIQREGKLKEELPIISAVFWNRVNQGMRLDADPTTQYALGKSGDWWPQLNLAPGTVDNPYNTYTITGLPPGPICNPGLDSIRAAIYPAENDYLFFVAKNDGTGGHAFASTLEEHERNRVLYHNK